MDGLPRFETRNDDDYFYPEKVISQGKELTWPAGVRHYSYRKDFEVPSGNGKHNVQIAFNVIPPEKKDHLPYPAGTMPRFCAYFDTRLRIRPEPSRARPTAAAQRSSACSGPA